MGAGRLALASCPTAAAGSARPRAFRLADDAVLHSLCPRKKPCRRRLARMPMGRWRGALSSGARFAGTARRPLIWRNTAKGSARAMIVFCRASSPESAPAALAARWSEARDGAGVPASSDRQGAQRKDCSGAVAAPVGAWSAAGLANAKSPARGGAFCFLLRVSLTMSYFHRKYIPLSSALRCFTVLFGMGRGGATSLWSSG